MAEINWGIINSTPNVFAAGLEGLQAGQQFAAQRQRHALVQRQADREEAQYQAGLKQQQRRQEIAAGYGADPAKARQDAIGAGDFDLAEQFAKLDTAKREEIGRKAEIGAKVAQQLLGQYPGDDMAPQRKAAAVAMAPQLAQYGVTPQEIEASDYSTGGLQRSLALGMTVNEAITKANADRTFNHTVEKDAADAARADKTVAETGRHNQATEGISRGQLAVSQGQLGVAQANLGLSRQRIGLEGQRVEIARQSAGAGKPPTEAQAKDAFNAARMRGAAQAIASLEGKQGFNPTLTGVGSALAGKMSRQYDAAKGEWIDSLLRATTGAAATKEEVESNKRTYFPQFGDSPDVVAQKAAARRRVQMDLVRRAGPAAANTAPAAADPLGIR